MKRAVLATLEASPAPSPDVALLAALDARPAYLDELRTAARHAYHAARDRSNDAATGDDWQMIDARWQQLRSEVTAAQQTAARVVCEGSAPHKAARIAEARALLAATEFFDCYLPPKAPKPGGMSAIVFAHRATSPTGGEHFLETMDREAREQALAEAAA